MSWWSDLEEKVKKETKNLSEGKGVQVNPARDAGQFLEDVGDVGEDVGNFVSDVTGESARAEQERQTADVERSNARKELSARNLVQQDLEGLEGQYDEFKGGIPDYEKELMNQIDRKIYNQVQDAITNVEASSYNRGLIATGGSAQQKTGEVGLMAGKEEARLDEAAKSYIQDLDLELQNMVQDAQYNVANLEAAEAAKEMAEALSAMEQRSQAIGDFWTSIGTVGGLIYANKDRKDRDEV